jgi:hypothetical protein
VSSHTVGDDKQTAMLVCIAAIFIDFANRSLDTPGSAAELQVMLSDQLPDE